jgi:hypothetical protein
MIASGRTHSLVPINRYNLGLWVIIPSYSVFHVKNKEDSKCIQRGERDWHERTQRHRCLRIPNSQRQNPSMVTYDMGGPLLQEGLSPTVRAYSRIKRSLNWMRPRSPRLLPMLVSLPSFDSPYLECKLSSTVQNFIIPLIRSPCREEGNDVLRGILSIERWGLLGGESRTASLLMRRRP